VHRFGYKLDHTRIGIALWVDNCFTFGNSAGGAI
jgi:hypothetical protein